MQVSIIVPVYNVEKYIIECLESAIKQGLKTYEIICIDDCGTDNSVNLIKNFINEKNLQDVIKIIKHDVNSGLSVARNTGVDAARGDYIFFLDSDDLLKKNTLSKMYDIANKENLDLLEGGVSEFFETDYNISLGIQKDLKEIEVMKGAEYLAYVLKNKEYMPMACGKLYKTTLLRESGGFYKNLISEDEEFTPRILLNSTKVRRCSILSYLYRRRDGSITTSYHNNLKWIDSYIIIIKKLLELSKTDDINKQQKYYIEQRAAQMTLSLLKNVVAYDVKYENVAYILEKIKENNLKLLPLKSHFIREKFEGLLFLFPQFYMFFYRSIKNVKKNY